MPVRKIPKNYLGVTGGFASRKNGRMLGFESLLEKDYFVLLEYDDEVESFEEQPVRIPLGGRERSYVPDVLVRFRQRDESNKQRKPVLAEIKTSDDFEKNKAKYAKKFAAAKQLAASNGWVFQKRSEKDIRCLRLGFLKFLREYHTIEPDETEKRTVMSMLNGLGGSASYNNLLSSLCVTDEQKLRTIPTIWHLVATRGIEIDLNQKISDEILLWLPTKRKSQ